MEWVSEKSEWIDRGAVAAEQTLFWLTKQNLEWCLMRWNVFCCLSIDSEWLGKSFTIADAVELLLIHRKQLNSLSVFMVTSFFLIPFLEHT